MTNRGVQTTGNVIKEITYGNVHISICDDCFEKTPEGIERILSEYHAAGWIIANQIIAQGGEV
ncbi:hypothetical protein [Paenibacillus sp. GM2]|uniref:hypothetical protein n=1 Tax=Paenibacillus sp. GM2 TaxID=1622070 RepID=UPI00083847E6|nr:hypothetical protein [Paenibacillus sp. GM2]